MNQNQVAKVHQAWDSRSHYDLENRRMVSIYGDKEIGRIRGRDKSGRVDYDKYWVMKPFKGENLLKYHSARLDSLRGARWDEANDVLIEARKLKLSEIATLEEGSEENEEEVLEETVEEDFIPAPFIPQGIEMPTEGTGPSDAPAGMDGGMLPPVDMAPEAPSPFAPLPPL